MTTDLTFFTNEPNATLVNRFNRTLQAVKYFDVLVGYFRTSGFHQLAESLEGVEKIRILVGLNVDQKSFELIDTVRTQTNIDFNSHKDTRNAAMEAAVTEIDASSDDFLTEYGIKKFIEFLSTDCTNSEEDIANGGNGKKLEFRAYPSGNIHAKVYISRYKEEQVSYGSVITGSSNFSHSGLIGNREFNVELKNRGDVDFALGQFEDLWKDSVDLSEKFVETVRSKTWLNEDISPYQLYLKMLYEYLKEDINIDKEVDIDMPEGFMDLQYQKQAIVSAKKILEAFHGVFLADVVGLGKTYISAMLAQQLGGGKLVICPPVLIDYWKDTFFEFGVKKYEVESLGKLDRILEANIDKYETIFIDEAHRFRNEYTQGFEKLIEICYGKKIVLVTATPLNNTFLDIFNQIKLFQSPKRSTIPGVVNLEKFFNKWMTQLNKHKKSDPEYLDIIKDGAEDIREKILKYIMVRRTRSEIKKYFSKDMDEQGLFFPEISDPKRMIYKFDATIGLVFTQTILLLKQFSYSRYMPLVFLNRQLTEFELQAQRNVGGFMKGILIKRLESSFYAFKKSVGRFVKSYEDFIEMFGNGRVLISKNINVYDLIDEDNEERIQKLIEEERVHEFKASEFTPEFEEALQNDLEILKEVRELWQPIDADPKLDKFISELETGGNLNGKKILVFTESVETGDYLFRNLKEKFGSEVLFFSSNGGLVEDERLVRSEARKKITNNYDPRAREPEDDIQILISTDVLAEGVNLHRSFSIINYDLPWNPTRVLQRVGRVNRVGTVNKEIHIYNFFPTDESDEHLGLEDNIKSKIQAFHDTLGEDARYLTDEEVVSSHELFGDTLYKKLTSKKTYEQEDGNYKSELEYLAFIRDIRDNDPKLFEKIKRLPKKARSAKSDNFDNDGLITFFRKGKLKKFMFSDGEQSEEIPFFDAVNIFKCEPDVNRQSIPKEYYDFLKKNKEQFDQITSDEISEPGKSPGGRSNEQYVIGTLKSDLIKTCTTFTDEDEEYIQVVLEKYNEGVIPKNITKRIKQKIEKEGEAFKILAALKREIPGRLLGIRHTGSSIGFISKREVILSEWLAGENNG
jgi:superfamily II DNA/RNA helicase